MTTATEAPAARRFQDRHATREELVERYLPLARHLARRYNRRGDIDDLNQVASIALLKAIDRFDPDRGLAFTSFAVPTILGELKRYFRDHGWMVRVPRDIQELKLRLDTTTANLTSTLGRSPTPMELANHTGASVEHVLEALAANTAHYPDSLDKPITEDGDQLMDLAGGREDPGFARAENAADVDRLLGVLSERERTILRLRFEEDLTQAEIGEQLELSQMHVSRLIRRSIATLQQAAGRAEP
jgi:RNA polymerase sigma-B factor